MHTTKKLAISTIFILILITALTILIPLGTAHDPPWRIPTYAYISPTPNPVGVGQPVTVVMWLLFAPPTATGNDAGDRWTNMKVTVTKPNGSNESLGTFMADPTGSTYTTYVPDEIGEYTFYLEFPGTLNVHF